MCKYSDEFEGPLTHPLFDRTISSIKNDDLNTPHTHTYIYINLVILSSRFILIRIML